MPSEKFQHSKKELKHKSNKSIQQKHYWLLFSLLSLLVFSFRLFFRFCFKHGFVDFVLYNQLVELSNHDISTSLTVIARRPKTLQTVLCLTLY